MDKIRKFFTEDSIGVQIYSFAKTYAVVFGGIYFFGIDKGEDPFAWVFILATAKFSLVSVLRNVWKLTTENRG